MIMMLLKKLKKFIMERDDCMASEMLDTRMQENLQIISKLRLLDDDLMNLVFDKNIEATELLLNIILQRSDLKVLEVVAQREYKNSMAGGRSITIDIYARDSDGKIYDVEVQRADRGADFHRARFHSSMIDTRMLRGSQNFKDIHDSYVIFITENDIIGEGLSLYHIDRVIKETGADFVDGSHIIYVNGSYKNDSDPIGKLMHDFRCTSPADMFFSLLARQVKYFKETEGGRKVMCKAVEELAEKRAKERVLELARNILANGKLSVEEVAECTELPINVVEELAESK